jgi:hypothetical protein
MHATHRRSSLRLASCPALVTAVVALAVAWGAPAALADGDPASDVLAQQSLFLPQDAGLPVTEQAQLAGLLQAAARRGYPIRVALVASATDLGSVTALWGQPENYAKFLGQELALVYRGPLLVVMPHGAGFYDAAHPSAPVPAAVAGRSGGGFGAVALTTVQRLAAAAGHPVAIPSPSAPAKSGSSDIVAWIVFAVGAVLIGLAWAASLRARPPRWRSTTA